MRATGTRRSGTFGRFAVIAIAVGATAALGAAPASAAKVTQAISPQAALGVDDYNLMKRANVDMLRLPFGWDGIQANAGPCTAAGGACDWSFQDSQIGAAAANGLDVMPIVYGSAPFVNTVPQKPPTNNIPAWTQFVRSAAERYGPGGVFWQGTYQSRFGATAPVKPVKIWQIWNEQTSFAFFKPKPNTKKYAKILKPAGTAIHQVHKKSTVLLGGVFGETGPKGTPLPKFFKQLYKVKKIDKAFDAVAIHPYAGNPKGLIKQSMAIRKATKKAKDKKAKVWVTELGYTSGKKPKGKPVTKKSQKGQAKALTKAYKALHKKRKKLNLAGIVWFTWQDVNDPSTCKFCQQAGLVDTSGKPKKAYKAYKKAAR